MDKEIKAKSSQLAPTVKSGFTYRTLLAILYGNFFLQPISIWLFLVTNSVIASAVSMIVGLFFAEIAARSGGSLTKQELFVMMTVSVHWYPIFLNLLQNEYYLWSPLTAAFGITDQIPSWWAPPLKFRIMGLRTFLHPAWVIPIMIALAQLAIVYIADLGMGLFTRELYIKQEKLEFPLARPMAEAALTLGEREPAKMSVLFVAAMISMVYNFFLYGLPTISRALFGTSTTIIPIPWIDLNIAFERMVPGMSFGIATDMLVFASGFIVPFPVVLSVFAGSLALYVFGGPLAVNMKLWPGWLPGMDVALSFQHSVLYVWISVIIGLSMAAAILPILRYPRPFIRAIGALRRVQVRGATGQRDISPLFTLPMWLAASVAGTIMAAILVPTFPWYLFALLTIPFAFVQGLIAARAVGETGMPLVLPYVSQGVYMLGYTLGYQGVDVWYAPLVISTGGSGGWAQWFKIADLTDTSVPSFIKAFTVGILVSLASHFIFTELFWRMSPIPSSTYPATQIYWPVNVSMSLVWVTRQIFVFKPELLLGSFGVAAIIYLVGESTHLPISLIGLATGAATPIPTAFSIFIGGVIGKILEKVIGKVRWRANNAIIVAGLSVGEGIIIGIAAGVAIISKALWSLPY